jgi:hypothetical protein
MGDIIAAKVTEKQGTEHLQGAHCPALPRGWAMDLPRKLCASTSHNASRGATSRNDGISRGSNASRRIITSAWRVNPRVRGAAHAVRGAAHAVRGAADAVRGAADVVRGAVTGVIRPVDGAHSTVDRVRNPMDDANVSARLEPEGAAARRSIAASEEVGGTEPTHFGVKRWWAPMRLARSNGYARAGGG